MTPKPGRVGAITSETEWEFDVYYTTHDLMRRGIIEAARSRVQVLAIDFLDAQRLAVWMVVCRSGFYVTRAEFIM